MFVYLTGAEFSNITGRLSVRGRAPDGRRVLLETTKVEFTCYAEDEDGDVTLRRGDRYESECRTYRTLRSRDRNGIPKENTFGNLPSAVDDLDAQCAVGVHGCAWHRCTTDENGYVEKFEYDERTHLELEETHPARPSVLYLSIRLDVTGRVTAVVLSDGRTWKGSEERDVLSGFANSVKSADVLVHHGEWVKTALTNRFSACDLPMSRWPMCVDSSEDANECRDRDSLYEYACRRSCTELTEATSDAVLEEELSVLRDYERKVKSRRLVETVLDASRLTGTFPGGSRKQVLSSMLCREAARRGFVFPRSRESSDVPAEGGGLVLEPVPGIHDRVDVYDFKSYYPRFVLDRNVDEATALEDGSFVDGSVLEGLLPSVLEKLVRGRDERPERSAAYKRVANACVGCLAISGRGRLYNHVTSSCRRQLAKLKKCAERNGARVLYGDTDSLFVKVGADGRTDLERAFAETVGGKGWQKFLRRETYRRLLLTTAKKRYAFLREDGTVGTVGMLNLRDDAEPLVSNLDRKLVEIALRGDDPESALESCAGAIVELATDLKTRKTLPLSDVRRLSRKETNTTKFRRACAAMGLYRPAPYYVRHEGASLHPSFAACRNDFVDATGLLDALRKRCPTKPGNDTVLGVVATSVRGGRATDRLLEVRAAVERVPTRLTMGTSGASDVGGTDCCSIVIATSLEEERATRRKTLVFHSEDLGGGRTKLFVLRCGDPTCVRAHDFCVGARRM